MITREQSTEFIKRLVANPETEMANVQEFLDNIGLVFESIDTLNDEITERDEKIRTLQDTNTKLLLTQLGAPNDPEEDHEMTLEEFAHKM